MIQILRSHESSNFGRGSFNIRRIRPGSIIGRESDPSFGPFSVMDHANLGVGTVVSMHEHKNDEILSYMWKGKMRHEDSAGNSVTISPSKLMMMNAGRSFWHEESTPDQPVEMLQIFIRPAEADLDGQVSFFDRGEAETDWSLIAGPESESAPLKIRQAVTVYDHRLGKGERSIAPFKRGLTQWLYVMDGAIRIGGELLEKGDAVTDLDGALPEIVSETESTVVLFLIDRSVSGSRAGTISG